MSLQIPSKSTVYSIKRRSELEGTLPIHEYVFDNPTPIRKKSAQSTKLKLHAVDVCKDCHEHAYVVQNIKQLLPLMNLLAKMDSFITKEVHNMEESLLTLATTTHCTEGVFYASIFRIEYTIICRYLESGVYKQVSYFPSMDQCW